MDLLLGLGSPARYRYDRKKSGSTFLGRMLVAL